MAHHLLQNCCCWLLAAAAADSIINISVLYCYLGVITLVWCEMFALWICSSYISSCVRGCSVALSQSRLTYRHDLVLHCIVSNLSRVFAESHVYAELPGMHASVSPQANSYCNILLSWHCNLPWILQFSCSVWSDMYFGLYSSFGICKRLQSDQGGLFTDSIWAAQISYYNTIEISVLGHYLQSSLSSLCNAFSFIQAIVLSRSWCRKILDEAAELSISVSRRIFLARNCVEW